ncbi:MAG: Gfo/Idh/MocA family oxidoreductase [Lachnospiraceae bacterium]|nr:Gfo/Idh/MocA family oxidoreductase [Lachnospiraceae bacterium]
MSKVNIVIIGAGEIAVRRHIPALLKGEHTNFYGVFNKHPESTKRIAERHNVYAYESLEEVLSDPNVDAVLISTSPELHAELAIAALKSGKHVLLEKPMTLSVEEAVSIDKAAKETGLKLELLHVQRFYAQHVKAKELLDSGAIGKLLTVRTVLGNSDPEVLDGKKYPGWHDALFNIGVHRADLLRWLVGSEVKGVYAQVNKIIVDTIPGDSRETNDHAAGILQFENGVVGTLIASKLSFHGEDRSTTLIGTKGAIITFSAGHDVVLKLSDGTTEYFDFESSHPQGELELTDLHERFALSILNDTDVDVTGEDGIEAVRIVEGFEKANKEKKYQEIR